MKSEVLNYTILLQKEPEGGYTVTVPALPGCVTYGENIEEAKKMAEEAISLYIEDVEEHHEEVPVEKDLLLAHINIEKIPTN